MGESTFELEPTQVEHLHRVLATFETWVAAFDVSKMGSGKSEIAIECARRLGVELFVICEKQAKDQWQSRAQKRGVTIRELINYDVLHGVRGSDGETRLSHKYLVRDDSGGIPQFQVTAEFIRAAQNGILLVFDESQRAKNHESLTFRSCHALVKAIVQLYSEEKEAKEKDEETSEVKDEVKDEEKDEETSEVKDEEKEEEKELCLSRILLASATPCAQVARIFHILCLLGIVTADELFLAPDGRQIQLTGFNQFRDWCREYGLPNFRGRKALLSGMPLKSRVPSIVMDLYTRVVKETLLSAMETTLPFQQKVQCAFLPLESDAQSQFMNKLQDLSSRRRKGNRGLGRLNSIAQELELMKVPLNVEFTRSILETKPGSKVIIYCYYLESRRLISEALSHDYECLVLSGRVPDAVRKEMYEKFQRPDDSYRVLITQPRISASCLDLDDQHGNFPRYTLINASFDQINNHQTIGRTCRKNTMSQPYVFYIFVRDAYEDSVLNSMKNKGEVMSSVVIQQSEVYPNQYSSVTYDRPRIDFPQKNESHD